MPIPVKRSASAVYLTSFTPSIGTSPVAGYIVSPVRGRINAFSGALRGAITTANATMTVVNVTTGVTIGTFTVIQSGSAAGQKFAGEATSNAASIVSLDDVISVTPSGASGAGVAMDLAFAFQAGGV